MKRLRNWDNKTWLSSKKYITSFNSFLKSKIKFNNNTQILDVGCGRANIISALQKKYKFNEKAIGIDVVKNKDVKTNVVFKKIDAIKYLKKSNNSFDLILIKQTIHFFSKNKINILLNLCKKRLKKNGVILIFSLKTKNNQIPSFKLMKKKLCKSLSKDKIIFTLIKMNIKKLKLYKFKYKVLIRKSDYIKMIKNRFMSCLIYLPKKEILKGIKEIQNNFKDLIKFDDVLECIFYKK
ncbi:class I SAM-dependent methyltransferase [Pelagibacteraceae bacterium]|nr:class I SAM-dependent methyltransferase [Pelagibacteraceae bacterium]